MSQPTAGIPVWVALFHTVIQAPRLLLSCSSSVFNVAWIPVYSDGSVGKEGWGDTSLVNHISAEVIHHFLSKSICQSLSRDPTWMQGVLGNVVPDGSAISQQQLYYMESPRG